MNNYIQKAEGANEYLRYLFEVWYLYIDPNGVKDWDCGYCRNNVKSNFLELLNSLITLHKEKKMLDAL